MILIRMIHVFLGVSVMMTADAPDVLAQDSGATQQESRSANMSEGTRVLTLGNITVRVLAEARNLGSQVVEVAEIVFPAGLSGDDHLHAQLELFYIVSGRLEHTIDGITRVVEAGQLAIVRPGDRVRHGVPFDEPVVAVVIWAPGGAVRDLMDDYGFKETPLPTHRR